MPAQLTKTSNLWNLSIVVRMTRSTSASFDTSAVICNGAGAPFVGVQFAATSFRFFPFRPTKTSHAPFVANSSAVLAPMPDDAPVIKTTLFEKSANAEDESCKCEWIITCTFKWQDNHNKANSKFNQIWLVSLTFVNGDARKYENQKEKLHVWKKKLLYEIANFKNLEWRRSLSRNDGNVGVFK